MPSLLLKGERSLLHIALQGWGAYPISAACCAAVVLAAPFWQWVSALPAARLYEGCSSALCHVHHGYTSATRTSVLLFAHSCQFTSCHDHAGPHKVQEGPEQPCSSNPSCCYACRLDWDMMQSLHTQGTLLPTGKCGRPLQSFGGTLKDRPSMWSRLWKSFDRGDDNEQKSFARQSPAL